MKEMLIKNFTDFGLFDMIYLQIGKKNKEHKLGDTSWNKYKNMTFDSDFTVVVFLPWRTSINEAKNTKMFPSNTNCIIYELPCGIVNPNPKVSRRLMMDIVDDFSKEYRKLNKIYILGYSVGQYPATFIANHFSVDKLILVAPGNNLGECLWSGIATQEVRRRAEKLGIKNHVEYDALIDDTNPIKNIKNLPRKIDIHLAMNDKYIPTRFGKIFVEALYKSGKKPNLFKYFGKGHILTLYKFALIKDI